MTRCYKYSQFKKLFVLFCFVHLHSRSHNSLFAQKHVSSSGAEFYCGNLNRSIFLLCILLCIPYNVRIFDRQHSSE
jgi:hypothetical protein